MALALALAPGLAQVGSGRAGGSGGIVGGSGGSSGGGIVGGSTPGVWRRRNVWCCKARWR
ncbi:MAG: hypothetical protein HZT43_06290 [Exiguobacterium profundum]|nr:MAG: hypothetical protein HZT43_06290 [Exiguobacterium profundum]